MEERSRFRCEYCLLPVAVSFFPHEIDHIVAEKHGGLTEASNLALTCWRCNRHSGSDLGSFDPVTGEFSFFFHPRQHAWSEHFVRQGDRIAGLMPQGLG